MADWRLILGDCLEVLPTLADGSVDAVVTDPPAGIGFMGRTWDKPKGYGFTKGWDTATGMPPDPRRSCSRNPTCRACRRQKRGAKKCRCECPDFDTDRDEQFKAHWRCNHRRAFLSFLTPIMAECLRVCRPGAVALVWALPRTSHWTGTALEDAGWQIEDRLSHLFGSGFPKHKSKLKPACEDWWLCRKPGPKWLGVEEGRIPGPVPSCTQGVGRDDGTAIYANGQPIRPEAREFVPSPAGRWPANVALSHVGGPDGCRPVGTRRVKVAYSQSTKGRHGAENVYGTGSRLDRKTVGQEAGYADADGMETVEAWECVESCPVRLLDEQAGEHKSGALEPHHKRYGPRLGVNTYDRGAGETASAGRSFGGDSGGVSRFFYCCKADRADRGEGNNHPCVKSTSLMSWLAKLACPPGGLVLDPFAGSGSTGVACLRCERRFIGIEKDPDYHAIALKRLAAVDGPLFANPAPEDTASA